jgi:hypothetical protein
MTASESRDGPGAGDHDETYVFGCHLDTTNFAPFTTLTFSRLLVMRSKVAEGLIGGGDMHCDPLIPLALVPQVEDPSTFSPDD